MNLQYSFCEMLDTWYTSEKERLKGCGPHDLGVRKEKVKALLCHLLEPLEDYAKELRTHA